MRLVQLLSAWRPNGSLEADAIAMDRMLRNMGFRTGIYAKGGTGAALPPEQMPRLTKQDVLLYHVTAYADGVDALPERCRIGLVYHGLPPVRSLRPYQPALAKVLDVRLQQLCDAAAYAAFCITDSEAGKNELEALNFQCDIVVRPRCVSVSDYVSTPDPQLLHRYEDDGLTNWILVGDVVPYHKLEDALQIFACYQRHCNPNSRLFFIGSDRDTPKYRKRLQRYAQALELRHVQFVGAVSPSEVVAYFRLADLFLYTAAYDCFNVPLVEAMYYAVPILAYAGGASCMLDGAEAVLEERDPMEAALLAHRILTDQTLRRELVTAQRQRQLLFSYQEIRKIFEPQMHAIFQPHTKEEAVQP